MPSGTGTSASRPPPMGRADVVVVGGGVIGLACAWRIRSHGPTVTVVDPEPGHGASWAAAGMLAPVTEAHFGEEALLELNLESARRWGAFAAELESSAGRATGYRQCGTLAVAADAGDRAWADHFLDFQRSLGLDALWVSASEARRLEPDLSPAIAGAVLARGDHQVDNRALVATLLEAAGSAGVEIRRARVDAVETESGSVSGVRLADGAFVAAPTVVMAAGCWSGAVSGLPDGALPLPRPVKGQILRLRRLATGPRLGHVVRALVEGQSTYVVPRLDGTFVVGATVEEQGFDTSVTADAVFQLLRDARRVLPSTSELVLDEAMAGLRPALSDNAPAIGAQPRLPGLVVAVGHYRNGVLLAPVTADAVASVVCGEEPPSAVAAFGPDRFSQVPC